MRVSTRFSSIFKKVKCVFQAGTYCPDMGPNPNAENNEDGEMFPANFDQNTANTKCRLRGLFPAIKCAANKAIRESDNLVPVSFLSSVKTVK